jgi:hypothetical protein
VFAEDPALRKRSGQFLTALLPPKPRRRGRPGDPTVTKAIRLLRKFRRQYPNEHGETIWGRIYPPAIPNYTSMTVLEQGNARQQQYRKYHRTADDNHGFEVSPFE